MSNFGGGNGTIYINEIEKLKETEYYLRKKRSKEPKKNLDLNNLKYQSITSDLGYKIDIPLHFEKKETINDKCFDTIFFEKDKEYDLYNIKTQGFFIEIPGECMNLISIESILKHMANIEEIKEYENNNVSGKLVKTKPSNGIKDYILITKVERGIYELKISIDEFLKEDYEKVALNIINSFTKI